MTGCRKCEYVSMRLNIFWHWPLFQCNHEAVRESYVQATTPAMTWWFGPKAVADDWRPDWCPIKAVLPDPHDVLKEVEEHGRRNPDMTASPVNPKGLT